MGNTFSFFFKQSQGLINGQNRIKKKKKGIY